MKNYCTSLISKGAIAFIATLCVVLISVEMSAQLSTTFINQTDFTNEEFFYGSAADSTSGAIYACGSYQNPNLVEALLGISNLDGTLTRLDNSGNIIWTNYIVGTGDDEALSVCIGRDGNIYITGYYSQEVTLSTVSGSTITLTNIPAGSTNPTAFTASYTPAGVLRWAVRDGGSSPDYGMSITSTSNGVVAVGNYTNKNAVIQGVAPAQNLNAAHNDVFIVKYGFAGNPLWYVTGGSIVDDYTGALSLTNQRYDITSYLDKIYVTGMYGNNSISFSGVNGDISATAVTTIADADATEDAFLIALNNSGTVQWGRAIEHGNGSITTSVAADCGGVYLGGNVTDFITHGGSFTDNFTSTNDLYLTGFTSSGTHSWTKMLTSAGATNTEYLRDLIADRRGNIYFAGDHSAPMTIGSSILPAATSEVYVAQYNNTGNYIGHAVFNGANTDVATCISKLANGKLIVGGYSNSDLDANQSALNASNDAFVWGLSHTLNVSVICCNNVLSAGTITVVSSPTCQGSAGIFNVSGFSSLPTWQFSSDGVTYTDLTFSTATINYNVPSDGFLRTKLSDAVCGTYYSNVVSLNVQEGPIYTCSNDDRVIELTSCSTLMPNFLPPANAACPSLVYAQNYPAGSTIGVGIYPMVIRDWDGNVVCNFNLRVEETNRPAIVCPSPIADLVLTDPFSCGLPLPDYTTSANIFDECPGSVVITQNPIAGTIIYESTLVELNATDIAGNSSNCQFIVNYSELTPPVIDNCPSDTLIFADETCTAIVPDFITDLIASDNCDTTLDISQFPTAGTIINTSTTVQIKVADDFSNVSLCNVFIYLRDTIAPVIDGCPSSIGEPLNATCEFEIRDYTGHVTVSDNCDLMLFYQTPPAGTMATDTTIVSLWAIDAQDNYTRCDITVTGFNTSVPSVLACPNDQNIIYDNDCTALLPDYIPNVVLSGNCLSNNFTQIPAAGTAINTPQQVEIFYEGNLVCSFNVSPIDITPPNILTALMDQSVPYTIGCSYVLADYTSLVNANDNCTLNLNYVQVPSPGLIMSGLTNVVIYAIDNFGNSSTVSFNVEGIDNTAPVIANCPLNQTINNNNNCQYQLLDYRSSLNVNDNCGAVNITQSPAPGTTHSGTTTITLTATDASNNSTSCSFTLTGIDVTAPTISCPSNKTLNANASCQAILPNYITSANAHDHCDANLTFTQTPVAGSLISGITTVTIRATDDAGLFVECSFTVTVIDNAAPVIANLINQTIAFNANCEFIMPNYIPLLNVTDNCDNSVSITQNPPAGTIHNGTTNLQFTAIDDAGHNSQLQIQVIPVDVTPPAITCPSNKTVFYNSTCGFILPSYTSEAVVDDNCDGNNNYTFSQSPAPGTTITSATTVTITVTDQSFLSSSCTFVVTPIDNTAPTLVCPPNQNVNLSANCNFVLSDYRLLVNATDNCTTALNRTQSPAPGTLLTGTTVVTITCTDAAGNNAQCSFSVFANDVTPPSVTCPTNRTLPLGSNCSVALPDYRSLIAANDNCDATLTIIQTPAAGTTYTGVQTQNIAFSITDDAGNTSNCSFVLSILDTTAPVLTCPNNQLASQDASCNYILGDYRNLASVSDNCSSILNGLVVTQSPVAGTSINTATTVTLTATDASGNFTTCTFSVSLHPNNTINISCPGNKTVNYSTSCNYVLADYTSEALVSAACGSSYTVTQSPLPGTLLSASATITLTATNTANQQASCTFTVTPVDNIAPVITCPNDVTTPLNAACAFTLIDYLNLVSVTDNCAGVVSLSQTPLPGTLQTGVTTVVITASDASGNSSTCNFTVTPIDNIAPNITCPNTQVVSLGSDCTYTLNDYRSLLSASDNCSGSLTISQSPVVGSLQTGNISVTLTASDASGNISTCTFNVVATDVSDPVVSCPADQTLSLGGNCSVILPDYRSLLTVTDNCDASPSINQSPVPGTVLNGAQNITVNFTVLDDNGNFENCSIQVDISDQQAPTINCPTTQISIQNTSCQFVLADYTGLALATDNCTNSASINIVQTPAPGYLMTVPTSVTLTATDINGNSSSCTFLVELQNDNIITLNCPNDQIVNLDNDCSYILQDYTSQAVVSVSCGGSYTIVQSPTPGSVLSANTLVTLTATSDIGQQATCSFNVQPIDITAPTITCLTDQTIASDADCNYIILDYTSQVVVTDNCIGSLTLNQSPAPGTVASGTSVILITATDVSNNSASCSFLLSPVDTIAPHLTCPIDQFITVDSDCSISIPDYTALVTYTDNCSGSISLIQSPSPGALATGVQNLPISITASDASGNSSSCTFQLSLLDEEAPSITCPLEIQGILNADCEYLATNYSALLTATDNCGSTITFSQSIAENTILASNQVITFFATDESGNSASCDATILLVDTIAPSITCPSEIEVYATSDCSLILEDYLHLVVMTAECGTSTTIQTPAAGTIGVNGDLISFTSTDNSGNFSTCVSQIITIDTIAPTLICPSDSIVPAGANCEYEIPNLLLEVIPSDNCPGLFTFTQQPASGTMVQGQQIVTITVSDQFANTATCAVTMITVDNEAPNVIACMPNSTVQVTDCIYTLPSLENNILVSDNCDADLTITQFPTVGTNYTVADSVIDIVFTITDDNGNTNTCASQIFLIDTIAPVIDCPADVTLYSSASECFASLFIDQATVEQSCENIITSNSLNGSITQFNDFAIGNTTIIYYAEDEEGNISSCIQNIIVADTIAPIFDCPVNQTLTLQDQMCSVEYEVTEPLVTDVCGIQSFTSSVSTGFQSFPLGLTSIIYSATDISGNTFECTQLIEVLDLIDPIVTCNDSMFFDSSEEYCGNLVILDAPTVIENCTVTNITSNLGWIENSPNYFDVGIINFIWEVTDQSGNTGTCTTVITITDVTAPVIECDSLITGVTNEDVCSGYAFPNTPIVTDNCGVLSITNDLVGNAPYSFDAGTSFIEYTATDIHGNSSSCITEVRIDDIQAPDIICPSPLTLETIDGCEAFALMNNPSATDNCSTVFNIVNNLTGNSPVSGTFSVGTTPVEFVVFDQSGQNATCSTTITVVDVSAPVITCESVIELTVPEDACVAISNYIPTSTDVCGTVTVSMLSGSANHIYSPGDYIEVWQADDEYNNSSTCEVNIHVVDITAPTIVCPNDTLVCASIFEFELPLVSDNCTGASWTQTAGPEEGQVASPGNYTIEYTAVDNFGLTSTCSFQYQVIPIAELTVNFPIDSICSNASVADLNDGVIANLSYSFDNNAPDGLFNPAIHSEGWVEINVTAGTGTCQLTIADSIYVNIPVPINVLADDVFCGLEGTLSLNAEYQNLNWNLPPNISINPLDEVTFTASAIDYGFYNFDLSGTDENGCFSSDNFSITFEQNPSQPNADLDQTIFQITETTVNGTCDPVFNISWTSESNATIVSPSELSTDITNLTIGTHLFILTNATENCGSLSDSIYIYVRGLEIPSGFSPNGDGTNDQFVIPGIENEPAIVSIFNRWGKEVWRSDQYKNDWGGNDMNGEELQDDTYFYEIIQANETSTGFVIIKRK